MALHLCDPSSTATTAGFVKLKTPCTAVHCNSLFTLRLTDAPIRANAGDSSKRSVNEFVKRREHPQSDIQSLIL